MLIFGVETINMFAHLFAAMSSKTVNLADIRSYIAIVTKIASLLLYYLQVYVSVYFNSHITI